MLSRMSNGMPSRSSSTNLPDGSAPVYRFRRASWRICSPPRPDLPALVSLSLQTKQRWAFPYTGPEISLWCPRLTSLSLLGIPPTSVSLSWVRSLTCPSSCTITTPAPPRTTRFGISRRSIPLSSRQFPSPLCTAASTRAPLASRSRSPSWTPYGLSTPPYWTISSFPPSTTFTLGRQSTGAAPPDVGTPHPCSLL